MVLRFLKTYLYSSAIHQQKVNVIINFKKLPSLDGISCVVSYPHLSCSREFLTSGWLNIVCSKTK